MPHSAARVPVRVLSAVPTCQHHDSLGALAQLMFVLAQLMFAAALVIAGFIVLGVAILWGVALLDWWDGVRNRRRSRAAARASGADGR